MMRGRRDSLLLWEPIPLLQLFDITDRILSKVHLYSGGNTFSGLDRAHWPVLLHLMGRFRARFRS